jgi:hypothetical protein
MADTFANLLSSVFCLAVAVGLDAPLVRCFHRSLACERSAFSLRECCEKLIRPTHFCCFSGHSCGSPYCRLSLCYACSP